MSPMVGAGGVFTVNAAAVEVAAPHVPVTTT
jgi:hypothetical protein